MLICILQLLPNAFQESIVATTRPLIYLIAAQITCEREMKIAADARTCFSAIKLEALTTHRVDGEML